MSRRPLHIGIDLGTTNSAVAAFDGEQMQLVRSRHGSFLTPSVVRIDARGNVSVGERARRLLDQDSANTRSEFKRLMGTDQLLTFAASGQELRPEQAAAEVLRVLRQDVADQMGELPERAVISVPALFELAQISATAEAARLAGFAGIEVIQEPVASAIAAGWTDDRSDTWLVYDLGGGTFDASLLETRDGLLRVVAHDGDNFLGGRDMNAAVVARVLEELERGGHRIDRADPRHAPGLRRLRHAAEEAKLDLAREREVAISVPAAFVLDSGPVDVDTWLDRDALDALALPLVDRSLQICLRLLASRGLGPDDLDRVVLVGGPTVMPVLRGRVATLLDSELLDGVDPMTLVARGAALFAATAGIDGRPSEAAIPRAGPRVWLQHPAVTSDPSPYVVGKVLDGPSVTSVRIERTDGSWAGEPSAVDDDRAFCVPVSLHLRKATDFRLHGVDAGGALVHVQPDQFRIVHGLTVTDPPLARSIGVALADDTVQIYLERGTPLPMRRTFVHHTVETVAKGDSELLLHVPIVQGEVPVAHLCRLVGSLQVSGAALKGTLPAGSPVEITLELDRGGRLEARAFVPDLEQSFDQVAWLIVPRLSPDALAESLVDLRTRASTLQSQAFGRHEAASIARLEEVSRLLTLAEGDLELARGGDADAGEKARRIAIEVEELLWEQEVEGTWPELADRLERRVHWASSWLAQYGSDMERSTFASMVERARELLTARRAADLERSLAQINRLGAACYFRSPGAWEEQFDRCASRVSEAIDLPRAQSLVNEGRAALERGDEQAVERIVNALWRLMPPDAEDRQLGHDSGLR